MKTAVSIFSHATHLYCPVCQREYDAGIIQSFAFCCNQPLVVSYDASFVSKKELENRPYNMWRYHELLPVLDATNIISLNEGWTPVYSLASAAAQMNIRQLLLKDESTNPTGSFKARGISVAVSKAKELGITGFVMPTAGNAGGALSAYAAKAGMSATIIMPRHTPETLKEECRLYGAELILINGLIDACGEMAKTISADTGAFNMSTLKEPYRLQGKKTLGYEIAEQLNWYLPDVIVYPTGGGTGLIAMWQAFKEMIQLGWIKNKLPRMVVVQSDRCDPMVQLFNKGTLSNFSPEPTLAYGLAVPYPFAKDMIQKTLIESNGTAIAVSEEEISLGIKTIAQEEGYLLSPEGSAAYTGLKKLIEKDYILEDETVLIFNTGSWYKYR